METKLMIYLLVAFCALLGATGQIFFKLASEDINANIVSWLFNYKLMIGLFFYGLATVLFVVALKFGNLSILYPIIATSYIWVTLFSKTFLGETFPTFKWAGLILIIAGIGIITR
ncbi:MAG: EamA family transporter [Candidatus Aenigmarchaeota archaeon]|nr:EamA family transporter [Candidatus Aenigmarchaeota archaeon]